jgi:hypothetical protein
VSNSYTPPRIGATNAFELAREYEREAARLNVTVVEYLALRAAGKVRAPEAKPETCNLGLVSVEIIDDEAARELDPTLRHGAVLRIDAPWTERVVVARDGRELLALTPTDGGQPASDPSWALYQLVCESLGHKDAPPEPSEEYAPEASAWISGALGLPPTSPMAAWTGKPRARRAQLAGRLRTSFGLPESLVEKLVGAPLETPPLPSLWPAAHDAHRIAEQRRAAADAEASASARAKAGAEEANRLRTPAELRAVVLEFRVGGISGPPHAGAMTAAWVPPDGRGWCALYEQIPGLPMPVLSLETVRVSPPSAAIVPPSARVSRWNDSHYDFTLRMIELDRGTVDAGAVQQFRTSLEPEDLALLDEGARYVLRGTSRLESRRKPHAIAQLCRGRLLHPALVAEELHGRALALFEPEATQSIEVPVAGVGRPNVKHLPPAPHGGPSEYTKRARFVERRELPRRKLPDSMMAREEIEAMCIAAAAGGPVIPGCLLENHHEAVAHSARNGQDHRKNRARRAQ